MAEEEAVAPPSWLLWARLAIGLAQGVLLYMLFDRDAASWWLPEPSALKFAAQNAALFVPVVLIGGLGALRPITLAPWILAATAIAAGIGWHAFVRLGGDEASLNSSWFNGAYLITPLVLFVAHHLIAAGDAARKPIAPYDRYFDLGWRHGAQLALATLFVGAFWAVLLLGASLFNLIKIRAVSEVIAKLWFVFPALCTMFAAAIHLTDARSALVRGTRALGLLLLSWLLPAMTCLAGAFLIATAFTGFAPLWATKAAGTILLGAAVVLVVLINAAYQDGAREPRAAFVLRWSARAAGVLLTPLAALAAYALYLRIDQYGLTPDRVYAVAVLAIGACYAAFYLVGAFWPAWMKPLEIGNLASAVAIIAVSLALFSPLADPARLSVDSQMARLASGKTKPEKLDVQTLRWSSARYGVAALQTLRSRPDALGKSAAKALGARDRYEATAEAQQIPSMAELDLIVRPEGATLPLSFLRARLLPDCPTQGERRCAAQSLDLNEDGAAEVIVDVGGSLRIFAQNEVGAWRQVGEAANLAAGPIESAAPEVKDMMIGGVRVRPNLFSYGLPKLSPATVRELKKSDTPKPAP